MIHIEVLLTEDQLAEQFAASIASRSLPERYFYWFPLSVKAWLELCSDGAYRNFARSFSLIEHQAKRIASLLPQGRIEVLSLGAGQGIKDVLLLKALRNAGQKVLYRPVDASQSLLEYACESALSDRFQCVGIKADIAKLDHLKKINVSNSSSNRLVLLLGNTLGAFDPFEYCIYLKQILRPRDFLLVDGEIFNTEETMAGYDNPLNRRFAFAPLKSIGIDEDYGELCFELKDDKRMEGLHLITKHFRFLKDLNISISGKSYHLGINEHLDMNFSYKFSLDSFISLMDRHAGLRIINQDISNDQRFCMILATPKGSVGSSSKQ